MVTGGANTFTTPQVAELIGVTQRKLLSFHERGYVRPSIQEAAGHGSKRLWSYEDVIRCAVIRFLMNQTAGTLRQVGSEIADNAKIEHNCSLHIFPPEDLGREAVVDHWIHQGAIEDHEGKHGWFARDEVDFGWPAITVVHFQDVHRWVEKRLSRVG